MGRLWKISHCACSKHWVSGNRRYFWMKLHPFWIAWIMVLVLRLDTDIPGSHGVKNRASSTCIKRYQKLVALISLCDRKSSSWRLASICQLVDSMSLKDNGSLLVARMQDKEVKPMTLHPLAAGTSQFLLQSQLPHPQNEVPPTCLPVFEVVRDPTRSCTRGLLLYGSWGECKNGWGCAWNSLWTELGGNKKHKVFLPHWNTIADLFNALMFNTFQHILSPKQWFPCQIHLTIVYLP